MLRPATPDDRAAVIALALAEDAAWADAPPVSDEEAGEFIDSFGPGVIFEAEGRPAGYAAIGEGGGTMLVLDPRDGAGPALEALVAWLDERGGHEIDAYAADAPRIAWLEANGFTYVRAGFDLARGIEPAPAPPAWPSGIEVVPYRPGKDDEAVHALIYADAAWAEVPGHRTRSLARVELGAHARAPRLGLAPCRAPRRLGRRPRLQRRARVGGGAGRRP